MNRFSLVEVLIGFAIVGIVASIAFGSCADKECREQARAECATRNYEPVACHAHIENECGKEPDVVYIYE